MNPKTIGYVAAAAVGIPLLLALLFKLLGAAHSLLSRITVCLLWLVSVAGGVLSMLYLWERRRGQKEAGPATGAEPV